MDTSNATLHTHARLDSAGRTGWVAARSRGGTGGRRDRAHTTRRRQLRRATAFINALLLACVPVEGLRYTASPLVADDGSDPPMWYVFRFVVSAR